MDHEDQTAALLAPSPEFLATVPVFPLIPAIKKDVTVRARQVLSAYIPDVCFREPLTVPLLGSKYSA
jgi:hypothetical protein